MQCRASAWCGPGGTGVGRLSETGVVSRVVVKWWCFDGGGCRMDGGGGRAACGFRRELNCFEEVRSGWERGATILVGALPMQFTRLIRGRESL